MTATIIYLTTGLLLTAAIVLFGVIRANRNNQQRVLALKQMAQSMDFTFLEKGESSIQWTFGGFELFSRGYSKKYTNVLSGRFHNLPVLIFDYQYTTGGGKNTQVWKQTVLALESDKLHLPKFLLRPENLLDKIGSALGHKDIDFETYPEFSKRYYLRSTNEEGVRKLFSERVVKYFEEKPGLSAEGDGTKLIKYRVSKFIPAENLQTFLQEGYELYTLFKTY
jgi:hypothetical protein